MTSAAEAIYLFRPVVWTSDAPGKGDILVTSKIDLVIVPLVSGLGDIHVDLSQIV